MNDRSVKQLLEIIKDLQEAGRCQSALNKMTLKHLKDQDERMDKLIEAIKKV